MKCKFPFSQRNNKTGIYQQFACGKCLPCRIKKRSHWVLRCQLEALQSTSRSFWSLTLADDAIMAASEANRRMTVRNFFAALRQSERRGGNTTPIRYFGCLEFGGQFGRPHWHFLIYNLQVNYRTPPRYQRGLPRPLQHISQWPHGHVDVGEYNMATTHYTIDYLTDFEWLKSDDPASRPVPYRTIRPAIGYYGLKRLATDYAIRHSIILEKPSIFTIGNRSYALDKWTRDTWFKLYKKAGGLYLPDKTPRQRHNLKLIEAEEILAKTPPYVIAREEARERHLYVVRQQKKAQKAQREAATSARYQAQQRQKTAVTQHSGGETAKTSPKSTD